MIRRSAPLFAVALLAVSLPVGVAATRPQPLPAPLAKSKFVLPKAETRKLSNGLTVVVSTNPEVPTFELRLLSNVGGYADPLGKEGLASVTFDMMDQGAGGLTAAELSKRLKKLGSNISAFADDDASGVVASGLVRNLEATLDLWTLVLRNPDFTPAEWSVMQARRVASLAVQREDPTAIAGRVQSRLSWGDTYRGRQMSEAAYQAIGTADMSAFHAAHLGPNNTLLLVGGALTADQVVPVLEKRLADWKTVASVPPSDPKPAATAPGVYFVDKPGAAQSMLRVGLPIGKRTDADYQALAIATSVLGEFTGRVNLNLREDKAYTYGANCRTSYAQGPGRWGCSAAVRTDATVASMVEVKKELTDVLSSRPATDAEVTFQRSGTVLSFPAAFELPGAILDQRFAIWRWGLPADWVERQVPAYQKVTTATANAAIAKWVKLDQLVWLIVGDKEKVMPGLQELGLPVVELDRDGQRKGS